MSRSLAPVLAAVIAACSSNSQPAATTTSTGPRIITGAIAAATYTIEVPSRWNGTLFLFSHGYVAPGRSNTSAAAPDGATGQWLLDGGNALAASSYGSTGWAIEDALRDQIALLDYFTAHVGRPARVIAWGGSLGGIITAGLVQTYPGRFAGAIPLCGVLAGSVAAWNTGLDAAYAFKTLLAGTPKLQVVGISDPQANLKLATDLLAHVGQSPTGRARIALMAALADLPGWFLPTQPEPAASDYTAWADAQAQWESRVDFPFAFGYRAELEKRARGNPSWNVGVDYRHQLAISADRAEVTALYRAAGLDLDTDLNALNAGATIKADPRAVAYLDRYITFDGDLSVPVLTMHTTADGLVIPQDESAYAHIVAAAGKQDLLRQVFVHRAGHCAFTSAEVITLIEAMLSRLSTGHWDEAALAPSAMNAAALALGPEDNSIGGFLPADPAFMSFSPGPYPRPFARGDAAPG